MLSEMFSSFSSVMWLLLFRFFNILLCILSLPIALLGSPLRFISSFVIDIGVSSTRLSLFRIPSKIFCSYSLVRSSFRSSRSVGQNCSSRIFSFSDGSVVCSPFDFVIGAIVRGVVGVFIIVRLANRQNAVVFLSIDAMWVFHA